MTRCAALVAGRYDGRFAGDDAGPFSVFIDRAGVIYGWAISPFDGPIALTGSADTAGGFVAGNASTGATFSGAVDSDGTLSGTWELDFESGTFLGTREVSVAADLDQDLVELLAGTYIGTSNVSGVVDSFTILLDSDGNLSEPAPDNAIAGTIISTSGTSATFEALSDEGDEIRGTVNTSGALSGSFENDVIGESGTFSGTRQ